MKRFLEIADYVRKLDYCISEGFIVECDEESCYNEIGFKLDNGDKYFYTLEALNRFALIGNRLDKDSYKNSLSKRISASINEYANDYFKKF